MPATSNGRGKQRGKIPITAGSSAPRRHRDADEELDELRHGAELRRDRMAEPNAATTAKASAASAASSARDAVLDLKSRIGKSVLGQERMVESMLIALLANGNLLIESLPGLAKTRAIKTLAKHLAADLSRVQFTPDLLPSDIIGAEIYLQTDKGGQFQFQKGPIFANLVLADEINRAPAKVQSAHARVQRGARPAGTPRGRSAAVDVLRQPAGDEIGHGGGSGGDRRLARARRRRPRRRHRLQRPRSR